MSRRRLRLLPLLGCLLVCAACGEDGGGAGNGTGNGEATGRGGASTHSQGCAVSKIDVRAARVPRPVPGLYWGQEIWLTYKSEAYGDFGFRSHRSRSEALDLARTLCTAAHAGEDIGVLARKWSNGMGGIAKGFVVVPEPAHREDPDERDIALITTAPGAITPLIEWRGGFWFAKRIAAEKGRALGRLLEQEVSKRAQARVIHIHHRGAFPRRAAFDQYTQQQAVQKAWAIIRSVNKGADFQDLARRHSNDQKTRARSGLLSTIDPITKRPTDWVRWGDRNFSQPLLDVILEKGVVGRIWPEPVLSGQGVDIVLVVARESGQK